MIGDFVVAFTSLFVALDIIGVVPMYLGMTKDMERTERRRIVNTSMLVAFVVAAAFVFVGQTVFKHLGIQIADFKIAGGVILLLISLADLLGGPEGVHRTTGSTGIVPLAVPLISGPGALTTLVYQISQFGYLVTLASLVLNYFIAWAMLRNCDRVTRLIGKDGTVVLSKIAALLLAAIAVAMIRGGVFDSLSEWLRLRESVSR